jgi:hypothetical protein
VSLLDRGAPTKAGEAIRPYAGNASRPVMLLTAQVALAEVPVTPDSAALKASAGEVRVWVAAPRRFSPGALGRTGPLDLPLRSLRAEASRYALAT